MREFNRFRDCRPVFDVLVDVVSIHTIIGGSRGAYGDRGGTSQGAGMFLLAFQHFGYVLGVCCMFRKDIPVKTVFGSI